VSFSYAIFSTAAFSYSYLVNDSAYAKESGYSYKSFGASLSYPTIHGFGLSFTAVT